MHDHKKYKLGWNATCYWIVIKPEKLTIGPLNEHEFDDAIWKYKVSISLK